MTQQTQTSSLSQPVKHQSSRKRRIVPPAQMQLQITPLIDVIFQLLIYFMVTASFAVGEGALTAELPTGGDQATDALQIPEQPIVITLQTVGYHNVRIEVQGMPTTASFSQLRDMLIDLQYDPAQKRNGVYRPTNPILIKPQQQVRWQHVVNAFNAAMAAGYENIAFAKVNS
ncbi:ExbD/TolR family protein [Poriferisphaera sp. WC338]|uniref:ExbD/TolR family protein n=1 Tax=Poriferisphaera sp. WC338 TaxID=3425129 RepID=UPI003D81A8A8